MRARDHGLGNEHSDRISKTLASILRYDKDRFFFHIDEVNRHMLSVSMSARAESLAHWDPSPGSPCADEEPREGLGDSFQRWWAWSLITLGKLRRTARACALICKTKDSVVFGVKLTADERAQEQSSWSHGSDSFQTVEVSLSKTRFMAGSSRMIGGKPQSTRGHNWCKKAKAAAELRVNRRLVTEGFRARYPFLCVGASCLCVKYISKHLENVESNRY